MSKITLRVATRDQYCYLEEQYEGDNPKARYDELYDLMNDSTTFTSHSEFYDYLIALADSDLTKWGHIEAYNKLSPKQKEVCQSFKRLLKRLKAANQE